MAFRVICVILGMFASAFPAAIGTPCRLLTAATVLAFSRVSQTFQAWYDLSYTSWTRWPASILYRHCFCRCWPWLSWLWRQQSSDALELASNRSEHLLSFSWEFRTRQPICSASGQNRYRWRCLRFQRNWRKRHELSVRHMFRYSMTWLLWKASCMLLRQSKTLLVAVQYTTLCQWADIPRELERRSSHS